MNKEIITINIGKSGITESFLKELRKSLKIHRVIKVKVLKNFRNKSESFSTKEIAEDVSRRINAKVVKVIGHTFIISKDK